MSLKPTTLILSLLFVVLAGYFFFVHQQNRAGRDHFREHGIETLATVTNLESSLKQRRHLSGRLSLLKNYKIEVTYFTRPEEVTESETPKIMERGEDGRLRMNFQKPSEIGELVITSFKIQGRSYTNLEVGDKIEVLYLPDDITRAMLKKELY